MSRAGLAAVAVLAVLAAGCSASATSTTRPSPSPRPRPRPAAVARCAWYTPTIVRGAADGQQVIIAATGPACRSRSLIAFVAEITGKPWGSTSLVMGSCIAQLARGGSVVQVWQTGFAAPTDATAGNIADTLEGDGWRVQVPPPGGPTPPPISSAASEPA
jgi:hypothetical protein